MRFLEALLNDSWSLQLLQWLLLAVAVTWVVIVLLRICLRRVDAEDFRRLFVPKNAEGWGIALSAAMLTWYLWQTEFITGFAAHSQQLIRRFRPTLTLFTLIGQGLILALMVRIVVVFVGVFLDLLG